MIYSPLHYLAAEAVRAEETAVAVDNYLFYLKPEFEPMITAENWSGVNFLPWPRFFPARGMFGRLRQTRANLDLFAAGCGNAACIRLHTPVIDTEAVNYAINFIRRRFPAAEFSVRLIPDGVMNVQRHPLGILKEMLQILKKFRRLVEPDLDYYLFRGDRSGADDPIVDRIYLLPGLPHEYDRNKVVFLSRLIPAGSRVPHLAGDEKRALVIGQPLVMYRRLTAENRDLITAGIHSFLIGEGVKSVYYKGHLRDKEQELNHPDYLPLDISCPLEMFLAANRFDIVIGICSTALLTARLILDKNTRVVAFGMNRMRFRGSRDEENLTRPFRTIGVESIDYV